VVKIDVKDKDPFANADAEPKDNITTLGFIMRAAFRYFKITLIFYIISALIYYYVFGSIPGLGLI
tara:strand:+ start:57 stop:251 length:195 start_codon:yes stop_codon:yes gene_type:complete